MTATIETLATEMTRICREEMEPDMYYWGTVRRDGRAIVGWKGEDGIGDLVLEMDPADVERACIAVQGMESGTLEQVTAAIRAAGVVYE